MTFYSGVKLQLNGSGLLQAFEESSSLALLSWLCADSDLHMSVFKHLDFTKAMRWNVYQQTVATENQFHVTLHVLSPEICKCKQCLQVKGCRAKARAKNKQIQEQKEWIKMQAAESKNFKIRLSQILHFTETGKLSDANYSAAKPQLEDHSNEQRRDGFSQSG